MGLFIASSGRGKRVGVLIYEAIRIGLDQWNTLLFIGLFRFYRLAHQLRPLCGSENGVKLGRQHV